MSHSTYIGLMQDHEGEQYFWFCDEGHEEVRWTGTAIESSCWYCGLDLRTILRKSRWSKNFYDEKEIARLDEVIKAYRDPVKAA